MKYFPDSSTHIPREHITDKILFVLMGEDRPHESDKEYFFLSKLALFSPNRFFTLYLPLAITKQDNTDTQ
jgi:hypothetical protein